MEIPEGLVKIVDIEPRVQAIQVTFPLFRVHMVQPPPTLVQRVFNRVGKLLSIFAAPLQHRGPLWYLQPPLKVVKESTLLRIGKRRFDIFDQAHSKAAAEIRTIEDEEIFRKLDREAEKMMVGLDTLAEV